MRIIAGTAKGRKLLTPPKTGGKPLIRPTADRAREALFSIIGPAVQAARVLDLFAGTGALGLEALSRGAAFAVFVDRHRQALELVRNNIRLCGFGERSLVLQRDLGRPFAMGEIEGGPFSLVFLDPPYESGLTAKVLKILGMGEALTPEALVVAENAATAEMPEQVGILRQVDRRRYGDTGFWLYNAPSLVKLF